MGSYLIHNYSPKISFTIDGNILSSKNEEFHSQSRYTDRMINMMASSSQIDQMIENGQGDTRQFARALMHKYSGYIQRLATSTQVPANFPASETQATNAIPTAISSPNAVISTQVVPTPTLEEASSIQRTEVITYTVKAGDTIFDIANKFNLNPETILIYPSCRWSSSERRL